VAIRTCASVLGPDRVLEDSAATKGEARHLRLFRAFKHPLSALVNLIIIVNPNINTSFLTKGMNECTRARINIEVMDERCLGHYVYKCVSIQAKNVLLISDDGDGDGDHPLCRQLDQSERF
jgi:hypothetical protein